MTEPPASAPPADAGGPSGLSRKWAMGFTSPAMILIAVFLVLPAVWTLYLGVTDYRLTGLAAAHQKFVGISNYRNGLVNPEFVSSLEKTVIYVLGSAVVGQVVLGFVLAWIMRSWRGVWRRSMEALVIIAWIIPSSVVAFLWTSYLQGNIGPLTQRGTLNTVLGGIGINWLLQYPLFSLIIFNIWRGTAFSMLLFGAAIQGIPPSYLETSRLVGASGWQQFRDVVVPNVRGHILTNLLLISLWTFNDFTPFLLTAGGPNGKTNFLPVYIYKQAFQQGAFGYGAAISTIVLVINLIVALFYLHLLRSRR